MNDYKAKFRIGQIVHHKLFGYTGVVFDIDPFFQSSDEWYEQVAQSRPSKNKPKKNEHPKKNVKHHNLSQKVNE